MAKSADAEGLLAPLLEPLRAGRHLRVVARPGSVVADRADGSSRLDVAWEADTHSRVCDTLESPWRFDDGCTAAVVGPLVVVMRAPDPLRRVEDLVQDGRISSLAGRTLGAAVGLGRNVLVTGPWCAAVELIAALGAEGQRPALVGPAAQPAPPSWPVLQDADGALGAGIDRVAAWSLPAVELPGLMGRTSGCVAWIEAGRLDRALMRFEAESEAAAGRAASPLQVLAAVDLVVVVATAGGPRVREIAEIATAEDGYRPRFLFASGLPPVPTALVPVGLPSFIDVLAGAAQGVLADELRHAIGEEPAPDPVGPPAPASPVAPAPPAAVPVIERGGVAPPPLGMDPELAAAPPPGWELDQLPDESSDAQAGASGSAEEAALAATFGLGPPPPPPGVAPMTPDRLGGGAEATFDDALRRARERDEELRAQEEPDES
jgi:hypothetical protein